MGRARLLAPALLLAPATVLALQLHGSAADQERNLAAATRRTLTAAADRGQSAPATAPPLAPPDGGIEHDRPPVLLSARRAHHSLLHRLDVVGEGLRHVRSLALVAPDSSWSLPLTIVRAGDQRLSTVDSLAGLVPACTLRAATDEGAILELPVEADTLIEPSPQVCMGFFHGSQDTASLQPKDFAFVPGGFVDDSGDFLFHLFYIRDVQAYGSATEKDFGHAVSSDLATWTVVSRYVLHVPTTGWDQLHVWAPSIVRQGPIYRMLYTGVDSLRTQRIGLANSTDLSTFTRAGPVFTVAQIPWADQQQAAWPYVNLRDPCVIPDPDSSGHWLMFYVTVHDSLPPFSQMVVGVARSSGNLAQWRDVGPLLKTRASLVGTERVESPSVFRRDGRWWIVYTAGHWLRDSLFFVTTAARRPDDLDPDDWSDPQRLGSVVAGGEASQTLGYWKGAEYLAFPNARAPEYLAAYDDTMQSLDICSLSAAAAPDSFVLGCPTPLSVNTPSAPRRGPDLLPGSAGPARGAVTLVVALPAPERIDVAVYDVLGRRLRVLMSGPATAGTTTVRWDGRDGRGAPAGAGVYFVRLACAGAASVRRVVLLR